MTDKPQFGELLPPESGREDSHDVQPDLNEEGWDRNNKIIVPETMTVKQLKTINPFRDDEAYIAEKQVDKLRATLREVDIKDLRNIRLGNLILSTSAIFMSFQMIFSEEEATLLQVIMIAVCIITPLLASKLFKATRVWDRAVRKLRVAARAAAFGEAYRSKYNLKLTKKDWAEMLSLGVISAVDVHGNSYRVITDMDYNTDNYVIIRRAEPGEQ